MGDDVLKSANSFTLCVVYVSIWALLSKRFAVHLNNLPVGRALAIVREQDEAICMIFFFTTFSAG